MARELLNELPEPDDDAQQHSQALVDVLLRRMRESGGAIPFFEYMQLVLYAPGLGYYSAGKRKFGESGDFITAPELSPLFSQCVATQCQQVLQQTGGSILEFGAGSGRMAADILGFLAAANALPEEYLILDLSADLRELQRETLAREQPELLARVRWLDSLPEHFTGVVLGNELLDAMPVHRVQMADNPPTEYWVAEQDGRFVWQKREVVSPRLKAEIQALCDEFGRENFSGDYVTEINLAAQDWVASLAQCVDAGLILLLDYGFPRHEYYHVERNGGTIMCHYQHRAHDDPLILPGLQDITAHVDFTAIAEAAVANGLSVAGYSNQAYFLMGTGLPALMEAAAAEDSSDNSIRTLELAQQVKKLTMPHEMGELFKVIALTKNLDMPLCGFSVKDMRGRL